MRQPVSDPIWGTPAIGSTEVFSRDMCCLDSPRCGGRYAISREATYNVRGLDTRAKARLTSWLVKQRQLGNQCPEVFTSTIDDLKKANDMSISGRADAILKYIKSKTHGLGGKLVYDPTAATTEGHYEKWDDFPHKIPSYSEEVSLAGHSYGPADLFMQENKDFSGPADFFMRRNRDSSWCSEEPEGLPLETQSLESRLLEQAMVRSGLISIEDLLSNEESIYCGLISCSECINCDELNSLLGYLKRRGWIEWKPETNDNKSCILTVEGYTRLEVIQQETKTDSSISMNKTQDAIDTDEVDDENIKVFISYSWDDENHKQWVKDLAKRLRDDGIEAILDEWALVPGDQLTHFMEEKIRDSKYVLVICTPNYCEKSNNRQGGVGYEDHVMTAEIYRKENHRKFIPILAKSSWEDAAPSWLRGKIYVDLSTNENYKNGYLKLKNTLLGEGPTAPPVRRRSANR